MNFLAFTPLIDPLPSVWPGLSENWLLLLLPLVVAISLVYKGTRVKAVRELPKAATIMAVQILIVMVAAAVALYGVYWAAIRVM